MHSVQAGSQFKKHKSIQAKIKTTILCLTTPEKQQLTSLDITDMV